MVALHAWFKPSAQLYLIPDGHITTAPLNLSRWKVKTRPIISTQEVQGAQVVLKDRSRGSRLQYLTMVSLKCPPTLTQTNLKLACTMMLMNAGKQLKEGEGKIAVCLHRTINNRFAEQCIQLAQQQLRGEGRQPWFDLVAFDRLDHFHLETLHTIPSTIIWEIWGCNPSMRLTLYDLRSLAISQGHMRLHQSLCNSLELTHQEAIRLSKSMVSEHCGAYGIRQEAWETTP